MIRVEASIRLSRDVTIDSDKVKTGFRITMRVDNRGYTAQLFAMEGQYIPLDKDINIYIDILYGELDIEKFINNTSFDFVSGKKQGEGRVLSIKEICIEKEAFKEVSEDRQMEIMAIIKKSNLNLNSASSI